MNRVRPVCVVLLLACAGLCMPHQAMAAPVLVRVSPQTTPIAIPAAPFLARAGLPGASPLATFSGVFTPSALPSVGGVPSIQAVLAPADAAPVDVDSDRSGPATLKDLLAEPQSFSLPSRELERMGSEDARTAGSTMMDRILGTRQQASAPAELFAEAQPSPDLAPDSPSHGLKRPDRTPGQGRKPGRPAGRIAGAMAGASLAGYGAATYLAIPASPLALAGAAFLLLLAGLFALIPLADVAQQDKDAKRQAAIVRVLNLVGLSAVSLLSAALTLGGYWQMVAAAVGLFLLYVTILSPSFDAGRSRSAGPALARNRL